MFATATGLPHVLPPSAYWSTDAYERERSALFVPGWHVVGTRGELANPGDFITTELFGHPIQVRNFDGELRGLSNVCAHRHCLLTDQPRGSSPRMGCQYHGWEYGPDGYTRRIPQSKDFAPVDREALRLPQYRVATRGQLVFVSLDVHGPELRDYLGPLDALCESRFDGSWQLYGKWDPLYPANWKVPVENTLEAYHVATIHPATFREAPTEERSNHLLGERHTAFGTDLPFSPHSRLDAWFQRSETWIARRLGISPAGKYWQHHVFPNLLFSFTDMISLCHCVIPTGPHTSRGVVRQFGRIGTRRGPRRWLAGSWGRVEAVVTRRIMAEDLALYPQIQRGLAASPHRGVLGRCEERIHAFQQYVHHATVGESPATRCCSPATATTGDYGT